MEVRHINRSSSATRQPKVYTGAKFEFESSPNMRAARAYDNNLTTTGQQPVSYLSPSTLAPLNLVGNWRRCSRREVSLGRCSGRVEARHLRIVDSGADDGANQGTHDVQPKVGPGAVSE